MVREHRLHLGDPRTIGRQRDEDHAARSGHVLHADELPVPLIEAIDGGDVLARVVRELPDRAAVEIDHGDAGVVRDVKNYIGQRAVGAQGTGLESVRAVLSAVSVEPRAPESVVNAATRPP